RERRHTNKSAKSEKDQGREQLLSSQNRRIPDRPVPRSRSGNIRSFPASSRNLPLLPMKNYLSAILALEDGRVWRGRSWAADGEACGEMVFNTSMTGYQEVLTDPSYAGQIVCMTYPLIGNYGVNAADAESARPWVEGFVVREASRMASSWRAEETLDAYLKRWRIPAIDHVDTRALVRHIRDLGAMRACLSTIDLDADSLIAKARASAPMENRELASVVTTDKPYEVPAVGAERFHV